MGMSISWFQEYPTCEIDYKLSYDLRVIDNKINDGIRLVLDDLFFVIGGLIILNYIYFGMMIFATIFFLLITLMIARKFLKTIKNFVSFIADTSSIV